MRIAAFERDGKPALGLVRGDDFIDLSVAAPELPTTLEEILAQDALGRIESAANGASAAAVIEPPRTLLPPLRRPGKIICVGLNYADHASESPYDKPDYPVLFLRAWTSLIGQGEPLVRPRASEQFDYEGEMVAVIGRGGRHVPRDKALDLVAGYSVFNDGSLRDYQFKSPQWTVGKNFDGSGGFGPHFVSADEVPSGAEGLRLQTRLNGEVVQDANTSDLLFPVAELIAVTSEAMTLEPGDIFVTGTPAGVGAFRKPPLWMKDGDVCEVEVEGLGVLSNPVADET